jgi:DNA-binding CsgD family transcriptional regulator
MTTGAGAGAVAARREVEVVRAVWDAARGGSSASLVVVGPAGIGKTAVVNESLRGARDVTIVRVGGARTHAPGDGLVSLVGPLLAWAPALGPRDRARLDHALRRVGCRSHPGGHAAVAAVTALVAVAAARRPLAVVVDDLASVDDETRRLVLHLAHGPVPGCGLVVVTRTPDAGTADLPCVEVAAVDAVAAAEIVGGAAGRGSVARSVASQLHGATGGNPGALHALASTLTAAQRCGVEPIPALDPADRSATDRSATDGSATDRSAPDVRDERLATALEADAARAATRSGSAEAGVLLRRAVWVSADPAARARRLARAVRHDVAAGDPVPAVHGLDLAARLPADAGSAADLALAQAWLSTSTGRTAAAATACREAAATVAPERATALLACAARAAAASGRWDEACRDVDGVVARAREGADSEAVAVVALVRAAVGDVGAARALLTRVQATAADPIADVETALARGQAWSYLHEHDRADARCGEAVATCRRLALHGLLPRALATHADVALRRGWITTASSLATEALARADADTLAVASAGARTLVAQLDALAGRGDEARAGFDRAAQLLGDDGLPAIRLLRAATLGRLALAQRRLDDALLHLEVAARTAARNGPDLPTVVAWHADLVEAHTRAGSHGPAHDHLARLALQADRSGLAAIHAVVARGAGLLADDGDAADEHFTRALELHGPDAALDRARTELCYGEVLRRGRRPREAREQLGAALATFDELGARPWSRLAAEELHASGTRTGRRPDTASGLAGLTAQEQRIAAVVGTGLSNAEVAAAVFLSRKTVEFHLSSIYRKLEIRSRSELVRLLHDVGAST